MFTKKKEKKHKVLGSKATSLKTHQPTMANASVVPSAYLKGLTPPVPEWLTRVTMHGK